MTTRVGLAPAVALCLAVALASCGGGGGGRDLADDGRLLPAVVATIPPLAVSTDVATAVQEAAASGVNRWLDEQITVSVQGTPTERDLEILAATLAAQSELTGVPMLMVPDSGAIEVRFAPKDQWHNPPGPETQVEEGVQLAGLTRLRWDGDGRVTSALVDIDSETAQAQRNRTIVHELLHALGLDHVSCASSVLNGTAHSEPTWALSALDAALLTAWYSPALPAATPASEISGHLTTTSDGPACGPQLVDARLGSGGVIWCERVLAGARPCIPVDGAGAPPVPPFAATRWLQGDVLYDHDPARYDVALVEGRRALCELSDAPRRPCQFTEGPGPLTQTDLWTDGQFVYDSP